MMKDRLWSKLLVCILVCLGVGMLGGLFTEHSVATWYPTLNKPSWTPPNWTFPIVWTLLYTLMGVSLWLVLNAATVGKTPAYIAFYLQLLFNFAWSILFFYLQNPYLALIDITLLWLAIIGTFILFWQHSRLAALLLVPYFLWVSYAFSLNWFIAINN
jgi:tryptophan-rich sensory protein